MAYHVIKCNNKLPVEELETTFVSECDNCVGTCTGFTLDTFCFGISGKQIIKYCLLGKNK